MIRYSLDDVKVYQLRDSAEVKELELIQSSTTPDPGHNMEK